jgi:hypothetical protein
MRARAWCFVGLLLAVMLTPAFAQAPGWVLYTHPDKLMSVWFPKEPKESEQDAPSPVGNIHFKLAVYANDERAYIATAVIYPVKTKFDIQAALDGGRNQMLANINGKAVSEKPIKLDGFVGREVIFEATTGAQKIHGVARMFASAKPPSAFIASAMRLTDKPDPDSKKFLASIHLGKKVETK